MNEGLDRAPGPPDAAGHDPRPGVRSPQDPAHVALRYEVEDSPITRVRYDIIGRALLSGWVAAGVYGKGASPC